MWWPIASFRKAMSDVREILRRLRGETEKGMIW